MRVRIIKNPPAPLMDGFNVGGMRVEHTYDVDHRMGRYLIIAGYAQRAEDEPELAMQEDTDPGNTAPTD